MTSPHNPYASPRRPSPPAPEPYPPQGYPSQPYPPQGYPPQGYQPYPPQPHGGPGYGMAPDPAVASVRRQAVVALVLNIVACVLLPVTLLLSIPGAVCAGVGRSKAADDLSGARRLLAWAWGLLAASIVLGIVLVVVGIIFVMGALFSELSAMEPGS